MLSNADRRKLRYGRLILADVPNSSGTGVKQHYAVMIDTDEQITEAMDGEKTYFVVPISNNDTISPKYLVPVTPRLGLTGYFQCAWLAEVHEDAIQPFKSVHRKAILTDDELKPVLSMIRQYYQDKASGLA
jgi:hypothetical protein